MRFYKLMNFTAGIINENTSHVIPRSSVKVNNTVDAPDILST